jgi:hypothetical protein
MKPLPPGTHASLACGILALVLFWLPLAGLVCGLVALMLALWARRSLVAKPELFRESDFIAAGLIFGLVGLAMSFLANLIWLVLINAVIHAFSPSMPSAPSLQPMLW